MFKLQIEGRFGSENPATEKFSLACEKALFPDDDNEASFNFLRDIGKEFDVEILRPEYDMLGCIVKKMNFTPYNRKLIDILTLPEMTFLESLRKVYVLLLSIPVTSCSVERLFSCVGRIKNKIRSTMSSERAEGLSLLCFEQGFISEDDFDRIIQEFKTMGAKRRLEL